GPSVRRMWKQVWHAFAEVVGSTPHRSERTQSGGVEHLQRVETRINRLCSFEVNDRRECSIRQSCVQFVDRLNYAHVPVSLALEAEQDPQLRERRTLCVAELERPRELDRHVVDLAEHWSSRWCRLRVGGDID